MNQNPFEAFGLSDFLDIGLVAVLIYALLVWFKRTKTAFVARGLLMLALVYTLARVMRMYMTVWIFQGFFAILFIAIVVIFQEELRSFFERIAVWSLTGASPQEEPVSRQTEIIVRSLSDLAHDRIGALVVLKGRDPLDRHVEGGWDLDGEMSEALIKSIFDSHSLGHDGALLIENGRVSRFGAHLPLSKEFGKITNMGTRHTAALGLSERTDALCLVASQEHGTIAMARGGEISQVSNLRTLQKTVEKFLEALAPHTREESFRHFFRHNVGEKLIALGLAVLIWLFFVGFGGIR
ncbi:MAG: DNA integrity scanning protein DisA nucleotide-binding domain protein [Elusimicrobia bacterium]|nr:DNA integrity scanning protein DisA nucleotide-binding domain protein [Elusimicrobiota bacterium]